MVRRGTLGDAGRMKVGAHQFEMEHARRMLLSQRELMPVHAAQGRTGTVLQEGFALYPWRHELSRR